MRRNRRSNGNAARNGPHPVRARRRRRRRPGRRRTRAAGETLHDYLQWQLQLSQLSPRQLRIGRPLVDAIDDDGYLRETPEAISAALRSTWSPTPTRCWRCCASCSGSIRPAWARATWANARPQLMPAAVDRRARTRAANRGRGDRTPAQGRPRRARARTAGAGGGHRRGAALAAFARSAPGARHGDLAMDTYIVPDCSIRRRSGVWEVALANQPWSRLGIHQGYERMLQHAAGGRQLPAQPLAGSALAAQEPAGAGDTLLKVVRCVVRQQSGFLEFRPQALRPLTLRQVAAEIGDARIHRFARHRAQKRHTRAAPSRCARSSPPAWRPRTAAGLQHRDPGHDPAVGVGRGSAQTAVRRAAGGNAQGRRRAGGAARTVAKYREALRIPSSHERVRLG